MFKSISGICRSTQICKQTQTSGDRPGDQPDTGISQVEFSDSFTIGALTLFTFNARSQCRISNMNDTFVQGTKSCVCHFY